MHIFLDDQGIITRIGAGVEKIDPAGPLPAQVREELASQLSQLRWNKGHGTVYLRALDRYATILSERGQALPLADQARELSSRQVPVDGSYFDFMSGLIKVLGDCVRALGR